jgi:hypothetical protein
MCQIELKNWVFFRITAPGKTKIIVLSGYACDSDFGMIKRKLRRFDRVYNLHTYTEIIIQGHYHYK